MDEFTLIRELLQPLVRATPGALGLVDDAALYTPTSAGMQIVLTKDMIAEGVHYLADDPPGRIAAKLVRVNLSDLAAMGAEPKALLFGFGLAGHHDESWLRAFVAGIEADLAAFDIALIGGDTISGLAAGVFSCTAMGEVPEGSALRRSGARPGDDLYVSGEIGGAGLGLRMLKGELAADPVLVERYQLPQPRIELGLALRGLATAAADVSDGLLADAGRIALASACAVDIRLEDVPVPRQCGTRSEKVGALAAGDDYELVFTAPPERGAAILALSEPSSVRVTRIGSVRAGEGVRLLDERGAVLPVTRQGFRHGGQEYGNEGRRNGRS